jgi:hypothetical protein
MIGWDPVVRAPNFQSMELQWVIAAKSLLYVDTMGYVDPHGFPGVGKYGEFLDDFDCKIRSSRWLI